MEYDLSYMKKICLLFFLEIAVGFLIAVMLLPSWGENIFVTHTMLELACIFLSFSTFLLIWNTSNDNYYIKLLWSGFFFLTLFDLFHTYYCITGRLLGQGSPDLSAKYWIVGRLVEALTLLFLTIKVKEFRISKYSLMILNSSIAFFIYLILLKSPSFIPVLKLNGIFTIEKNILEYFVIVVVMITLWRFKIKFRKESFIQSQYIFHALLLFLSSELLIILMMDLSTFFGLFAHLLRTASYFYLYKGVFVSAVSFPYKELEIQNNRLKENILEITSLNEAVATAEKENKIKSEYIANMSHELRTPLNIMMNAIQLMQFYLDGDITKILPKVNKHVNYMKRNCLRLLRLVNNLIDSTKIDAGFFQMHFKRYDIVQVVENITLSVEEYVSHKNIVILFESDKEEILTFCDVDAIERIMLNLISNAIKYSKEDQKGIIWVCVSKQDDTILISVKDNGIGISEEKLEYIFERYRQLNDTTAEGSGIGLALVKSLVELHEGRIVVRSKYRQGTEFIVELPIKKEHDEIEEEVLVENYISSKQDMIEKMYVEFSDIYKLS